MTEEVRDMIALRHSAEQRGDFEPLGRLIWLKTDHGLIYFPVRNAAVGEGCGPDLAVVAPSDDWPNELIVLGRWEGLPALRVNSTQSCPRCKHTCDVCLGKKKKLCELCGGNGWTPGKWLFCAAEGCSAQTGTPKANCSGCGGAGQIAEHVECPMCNGSKQMTCSRCKGTGKYSTGRKGGSEDFEAAPKCPACSGSTYKGGWKPQAVNRFKNAELDDSGKRYDVIGPIREFAIRDARDQHTRIFAVEPDSAGDYLALLVPALKRMRPQKAYLVAGIWREQSRQAVSA